MRSFVSAVAVASGIFTTALAADLPPPIGYPNPPPPIPPGYSWIGWYGGLQFGGAWDKSNWRLFSQTGSGFVYGGQLGFNYQFGQFVLGVESDANGSTLKANSICAAVAGTNCRTTIDYLASLRGKAGVAIDRFMAYADGGVAVGGFRFAQTSGLNQSWDSTVHVGWTIGAGIEYAFTDHVIAGIEYNYYGFPTQTLSGGKNPATITANEAVSTEVAKASYKF